MDEEIRLVFSVTKFDPKSVIKLYNLPEADQETVFSKKQDFDVDMNLLGWYDTQDESGGQNLQLKKNDPNCTDSCTYTDDRTVQKYYQKKDGNWLFAFAPKYV